MQRALKFVAKFLATVLILIVLAVLALRPSRPAPKLAVRLARDAQALVALCPKRQSIDSARWPPSFAAAGVKSVHIGHEGLYIATDRFYVEEAGVFIPCDAEHFNPAGIGDPAYVNVADGLFTYYIAG
jgi:hypothetical protein